MKDKVNFLDGQKAVHSDLHQRVMAIFSDIFQIEMGSGTEDLERSKLDAWDSVNHLRLVLELEQAFNLSFSDNEVADLMSLREVEELLIKHGVIGTPKEEK